MHIITNQKYLLSCIKTNFRDIFILKYKFMKARIVIQIRHL